MKPLFRLATRLHAEWELSPRAFTAPVRRSAGTLRHNGAQAHLPQLKMRLLRKLLEAGGTPDSARPLRQAANAAEALAWETPYPLLVFPCLFEEKVGGIQARGARALQPSAGVEFGADAGRLRLRESSSTRPAERRCTFSMGIRYSSMP